MVSIGELAACLIACFLRMVAPVVPVKSLFIDAQTQNQSVYMCPTAKRDYVTIRFGITGFNALEWDPFVRVYVHGHNLMCIEDLRACYKDHYSRATCRCVATGVTPAEDIRLSVEVRLPISKALPGMTFYASITNSRSRESVSSPAVPYPMDKEHFSHVPSHRLLINGITVPSKVFKKRWEYRIVMEPDRAFHIMFEIEHLMQPFVTLLHMDQGEGYQKMVQSFNKTKTELYVMLHSYHPKLFISFAEMGQICRRHQNLVITMHIVIPSFDIPKSGIPSPDSQVGKLSLVSLVGIVTVVITQ